MPTPRYVLHPGPVVSRTDGQEHLIDARALVWLHQVRREDCMLGVDPAYRRLSEAERAALVPLAPRYDGDYPVFARGSEALTGDSA